MQGKGKFLSLTLNFSLFPTSARSLVLTEYWHFAERSALSVKAGLHHL
jgi:hypothetical protein